MRINRKLSIVIPSFNDDEALVKTLSSIACLDCVKDLDVVVVDGGSSDNTLKVIDTFSETINTYISASDDGEYDAMNKGIDLSSTQNILFLMAGDCLYQSDVALDLSSLIGPCFISVYRARAAGKLQRLNPKSSMFFGLPHCHQGIIFHKPLARFNTEYRISADFEHYLACGYSFNLRQYECPFYVVYDEGHSGKNYLIRDAEIQSISRLHFGFVVGLFTFSFFKLKHLAKFFYKA